MKFEVKFYKDKNGDCPVRRFMNDLKRDQPALHRLTDGGINKLRDGRRHGWPLTRSIGEGLFELRVGHKDISRVIWFFHSGRKIVLVHGFVKKTDELPRADLRIANERRTDYLRRVGESE